MGYEMFISMEIPETSGKKITWPHNNPSLPTAMRGVFEMITLIAALTSPWFRTSQVLFRVPTFHPINLEKENIIRTCDMY